MAMNAGKYVFAQLLEFLPRHEFNKCRQRYHGEYKGTDGSLPPNRTFA